MSGFTIEDDKAKRYNRYYCLECGKGANRVYVQHKQHQYTIGVICLNCGNLTIWGVVDDKSEN